MYLTKTNIILRAQSWGFYKYIGPLHSCVLLARIGLNRNIPVRALLLLPYFISDPLAISQEKEAKRLAWIYGLLETSIVGVFFNPASQTQEKISYVVSSAHGLKWPTGNSSCRFSIVGVLFEIEPTDSQPPFFSLFLFHYFQTFLFFFLN